MTPESRDFQIPGDISSAAFWLVAAAAQPRSHLFMRNVGLNETRTGVLAVLVRMGAHVREHVQTRDGEPMGAVEINGARLHGTTIAGKEIPNVIDELPILAVAGALAKGKTVISECRRAAGEGNRSPRRHRHQSPRHGRAGRRDGRRPRDRRRRAAARRALQSFGDHRIAMAFAIAGLFAEGETVITDTDCVNTSYPGFHADAGADHAKEPRQATACSSLCPIPCSTLSSRSTARPLPAKAAWPAPSRDASASPMSIPAPCTAPSPGSC